jgi:PAS domain S-box-containing protein
MPRFFALFQGRSGGKKDFISFLGAFLLLGSPLLAAQESNVPPGTSPTLITNLAQFWEIPAEEKKLLHHARLKLLVYYCDPHWNVYWGRSDGLDTFLPLRGFPKEIRAGEEVAIDGLVVPVSEEFLWDRTSVKVLSGSNQLSAIPLTGNFLESSNLDSHFVRIRALVDSQTVTAPGILKLGLFAQNYYFSAFVHLADSSELQPNLLGKFVRIQGVFSKSLDAVGQVANVTLWTPGLKYVETVGSLDADPRFSIHVTSSENFSGLNPRTKVCVRGVVRSQQPGQAVTIWDDTGQIRILTKQFYPLRLGDTIEAIGYPTFQGMDRVLANGLVRLTTNAPAASLDLTGNSGRLHLADQVRSLDEEGLAGQLPVSIEGVVTWADPRGKSFFVSDSSGGILVMRPQFADGGRIRSGMLVKVDGVAAPGQFAPVITNAVVHQTGIMNLPEAPLISIEQALTGAKDGCWVQLRGYVREVEVGSNSIQLQIGAPEGEFTARVPKVDSLQTLHGAVVLVRGVCVVIANSRRQLTGIELWSPQEADVQIEQYAPENAFALPKRSIASLRRFDLFNTLNERVHTFGTVTLQVPGRYLYLQDGDYSVLVMSDQTGPLHPGDRVEVVGFSGHENGNFLLREAVYRRAAAGPDPLPLSLPASHYVNEDADGMLVHLTGKLLDEIQKSGEMHLTLQAQGLIFEARLADAEVLTGQQLDLGSQLALTGVYRIQRDEYGKPRSFLLNLRDKGDVRLLQSPPWWTLSRLLWVLVGTLAVLLVALKWALGTRRKNNQLVRAQMELMAAHDQLEDRVRERTRNLQEANEALRHSEERFVKAFQASPVPLLLQSVTEQRCVDVNDSFLQLTGYNRAEIVGQTSAGLKLFSNPDTGREILDTLSARRPVRNLQTELKTRDGKTLTVLISAESFELEGQPHFLMSLQDITERLNVENQLRQAQKMEVVGQIAAGVAHDFNNILTVIQGHAGVQLGMGELDESLAESLREISSAATRAASLTRQLLAFSRKQMLQRRPLDVPEALNNLSKMLQRIIGEQISLRIHCAGNLPPVFADAVNFEQIIINLAVNARDAMPRGGPLTITAEPVVIDAKHREREPDAVPGTFVRLSVADEGSGMDETVRSKIFEPFFTTKDVGKGTGMGLATVYGIVKQHQGWIEVESSPGTGSVFKVFLPVADQTAQKAPEPNAGFIPTAEDQSRTIFLVEDEASLREMASKILKRLGYRVVTAENGPDALALWPQHRGKIDLLLTDMVMPGGMTGRELADQLLREAPKLPVIYSTGYSMDLFDSDTHFVIGARCLLKPYDASTLATAINEAFASGN